MRRSILLVGLLLSGAAAVRPVDAPLLFAVLDIGPAASLPWRSSTNFIGISGEYEFRRVVTDTERLLASPNSSWRSSPDASRRCSGLAIQTRLRSSTPATLLEVLKELEQ